MNKNTTAIIVSEHGSGISMLEILAHLNGESLPASMPFTDSQEDVTAANDATDTKFLEFSSQVVTALCNNHSYSKELAIKTVVEHSEWLTEIFDEGMSVNDVASELASENAE
ncbi:MAG: hypothetical protein Q7K26_00595 [bacterium]|nr:hypothetical protein [bacterium]